MTSSRSVIKCGGDGMVDGGLLSAVGFPAIEGWHVTQASPHVMDDAAMADWVARYTKELQHDAERLRHHGL